MATPYRNVGSIESSDALASMTGTGAFMDFDSANGYARFGSKGATGVSLGTRIATVLNGILQNAITIAANALTITLLAGSTLAAQAVTATSLTATTVATTNATVSGTLTVTGTLTLSALSATTGTFTDTTDSSSSTTGGLKTASGLGVAKKLFVGSTATIAAGLTVSAGGILVSAGASALQALTATSANISGNTNVGGGSINNQPLSVHATTDQNLVINYNSGLTITAINDALNTSEPLFFAASLYTFRSARVVLAAATTGYASLNIASSGAVTPTTLTDGDMWYDGTNVKLRIGASTKTFTLT